MNSTSMAPKKIKNKIYENHMDLAKSPEVTQIRIVCANNVIPIARGCFIFVKQIARAMLIVEK